MADDLTSRVDSIEYHQRRVWAILGGFARNRERLNTALAGFTKARAEFGRETNRGIKEREQRCHEDEQQRREDQQRSHELDARIDKLVSEIGEYIRRRDEEK
jgi:hypothetical protein